MSTASARVETSINGRIFRTANHQRQFHRSGIPNKINHIGEKIMSPRDRHMWVMRGSGLPELLWIIGEYPVTCPVSAQESHERLARSAWERALYENFMTDQQATWGL